MGSPSIGLRFRDTTPNVDTIEAHKRIISQHGSAWWGWWKKDFEPDHSEYLSNLGGSFTAVIVDRYATRMFVAAVAKAVVGQIEPTDTHKIPAYYRQSANRVHGWLLIESLEEIDYDLEIANSFGDSTFVKIEERQHVGNSEFKHQPQMSERSSILVLSDLHFGPDYEFQRPNSSAEFGSEKKCLTDCIIEDLTRTGQLGDIASVIVTGDFTSNGEWQEQTITDLCSELWKLCDALDISKDLLIPLPGNHDVVRYPEGRSPDIATLVVEQQTTYEHERNYRYFLAKLLGREVGSPLEYVQTISLKESDLRIGTLDSCRILATEWTEYGFVGPAGIEVIRQLGEPVTDRPTFKLLAIHHHLLPVNNVEAPNKKGVTLSLDASKILNTAQEAGVHVAVHGHQHMPHLARYECLPLMGENSRSPIVVISNGSSGVSAARRPGEERNTYCILTFSGDEIKLKMRELRSDGRSGAELFSGGLGAIPATI